MTTRHIRILVPLAFALLLTGATFLGGQEVEFEVEPVGGKVSMLTAPGAGNIGVQVGDDGILVIETSDYIRTQR